MMSVLLLLRRLSGSILFTWSFLVALVSADIPMIGPAELTLKGFGLCVEDDNSPNMISIQRMKVNRTLESYSGYAIIDVDFDDTVGINLNIAKWGDGGYKPNYYIENNTYACKFFFKWVAKGAKEFLERVGRPPKCPVEKGRLEAKNFLVNYDEWPKNMVYGEFRATLLFSKNNEEIMCFQWFLSSKPRKFFG